MVLPWALLLLLLPPHSTTDVPKTVYAQLGGSVTIHRERWNEADRKYVRWYFIIKGVSPDITIWKSPQTFSPRKEGPPEWNARVSLSEKDDLIIFPVNDTDFDGTFKCEQQLASVTTQAMYSLKRVIIPTAVSLLVDEELSLTCQTDSNIPIKWIKPNGEIHKQTGSPYRLRVPKISTNDSGYWTCEAIHDPTQLRAKTAVTVVDLSPAQSDPIYTSISSHSHPLLPCAFHSAIPWSTLKDKGLHGGSWTFKPLNQTGSSKPLLTLDLEPTIYWRVPNNTNSKAASFPLMEKEVKTSDLSVQTAKLTTDNRGMYTCSLDFRSGRTLSTTVQLEILEIHASSVSLYEGDTVNLTCSLGHPMPSDLEVKWISPKSSLFSVKPSHDQTKLSIIGVRVQDRGQWKCELKNNETTLTSAAITLKIEKVPLGPWILVGVGSALIFILLIVIIVVLVRRYRQAVMYRRRKTRFCCCKNPQAKGFYKT